jgi:penicillin-binding protein 2
MGQKIGIDTIARYAKLCGFGSKTGLQLGDEKKGLIPNRAWKLRRWHVPWQEGETLSVAVGQSFVLTTPIQMVRFISAIFNGGVLFRPQVTRYVQSEKKENIFQFAPEVLHRLNIKEENSEFIKDALIGVVNEARGTGKRAGLDQIKVAGKTGTAQVIALPEEEDPAKEREVPYKFRDHAWFVSVAPSENPTIALAVLVEHSGSGGGVAAPIAKEMLKCYFDK